MSALVQIRHMTSVVETFRESYEEITATTIHVFLIVATHPAISMRDLVKRMNGVSQSAISRHVALLSEYSWRGGEGMQLIEAVEDPEDRRTKLLFLKPKGRAMVMKVLRILDPDAPDPSLEEFPTATEYVRQVRRGGAR